MMSNNKDTRKKLLQLKAHINQLKAGHLESSLSQPVVAKSSREVLYNIPRQSLNLILAR